ATAEDRNPAGRTIYGYDPTQRPSSATAEDRNATDRRRLPVLRRAAAVLRDGRGSQRGPDRPSHQTRTAQRPSSATAEDRNEQEVEGCPWPWKSPRWWPD